MKNLIIRQHVKNEDTELRELRQAVYSPCEKYRYGLIIRWDNDLPLMLICCLNPSTATETENDPTIERLERRARKKGYGGMHMLNIFAYRDTNPLYMKKREDPIGQDNDDYIKSAFKESGQSKIHCGWGTHGKHIGRDKQVIKMFKKMNIKCLAIKLNKNGTPVHPLYQPYSLDFEIEL